MNYWPRSTEQRRQAWGYLDSLELDLALVQEAASPADGTDVLLSPTHPGQLWGVGVVAYGLPLQEIPVVPLGADPLPGHLTVSHPGCMKVAEATLSDGSTLTIASLYGMIEPPALNGMRYAYTTVQRLLSDLTPILDRSKRRVIIGGDLNITPQFPPPDGRQHELIIERIKAFGLVDCLGATHSGYVRTLRHQNEESGTPWQNDWLFASASLRLLSCEALDEPAAWALSDHCPVVAEFDA
jgi:hypothetical protein